MMHLQLSAAQKYRICQVISSLGVLTSSYSISRMGPFASPRHNKVMFAMLMISVLVSVPFALGIYYYRTKRQNVDTGAAQVAALAQAGRDMKPVNSPKEEQLK